MKRREKSLSTDSHTKQKSYVKSRETRIAVNRKTEQQADSGQPEQRHVFLTRAPNVRNRRTKMLIDSGFLRLKGKERVNLLRVSNDQLRCILGFDRPPTWGDGNEGQQHVPSGVFKCRIADTVESYRVLIHRTSVFTKSKLMVWEKRKRELVCHVQSCLCRHYSASLPWLSS